MVNRVAAGGLHVRPYFYRYGDDALDLCDALDGDARAVFVDIVAWRTGTKARRGV